MAELYGWDLDTILEEPYSAVIAMLESRSARYEKAEESRNERDANVKNVGVDDLTKLLGGV